MKDYTVVLKAAFLLGSAVYTPEHDGCLFDVSGPVILGRIRAKNRKAAIEHFQKKYERLYGYAPRKLFGVL